jgi:hypothetical protein
MTSPISRVWELVGNAESGAGARNLGIEYRIGVVRGTLDLWIGQGSQLYLGGSERQKGLGSEVGSDSEAISDSEPAGARLTGFVAELRREAEAVDGGLTVRHGLDLLSPGFDAWGGPGSSIHIMRRIKERFDPHRVLNPGRFVGGI